MRRWIYKTDEAGKPRRFLDHREAALWATLTVGKPLGAFSLTGLLALVFNPSADETVGWLALTAVVLAIALSAWLLASAVLYLYVSLSGGVMDREARRRYRNDETTPRHP